jgi:hypothetical protein
MPVPAANVITFGWRAGLGLAGILGVISEFMNYKN